VIIGKKNNWIINRRNEGGQLAIYDVSGGKKNVPRISFVRAEKKREISVVREGVNFLLYQLLFY